MEWFAGLFQLPWGTILTSILIVLLAFKFIWELIEWFMKKFNIVSFLSSNNNTDIMIQSNGLVKFYTSKEPVQNLMMKTMSAMQLKLLLLQQLFPLIQNLYFSS